MGGKFQPAVLEIHGAIDYQFQNLINQISQRAKVFKGYQKSYFRRFCYETLGCALFTGQFDRCLNKVTMDGQRATGDLRTHGVSCTDDLGVIVDRDPVRMGMGHSIPSTVRTAFLEGRREFHGVAGPMEANCFLNGTLNNTVSSPPVRLRGGANRSGRGRFGRQDRSPAVLGGASHYPQTDR